MVKRIIMVGDIGLVFNCEEDTKEGMQKNFSNIYVTRFLPS